MRTILNFLLCFILIGFSACHLVRGFKYRNFDPNDAARTPHLDVKRGENKPFSYAKPTAPTQEPWVKFLDEKLKNSRTYAFLVIRNDSILYERYFNNWQDSQYFPSFSVAKSFVSALAGIAHDEGKIKSFNDPITDYLPELLVSDKRFKKVTIQHILDMRSGIKFNERYRNLFADVWKMGFSINLDQYLHTLTIEKPAGGAFEYKSVNSQLLGMVVERATGKKLSVYLSEKIWQPLNMESDAVWNIDSDKRQMVKGFCCLNATARDYAKFGSLYLHKGNWQGRQIISEAWVTASTDIDTLVNNDYYKNQWWMHRKFGQYDNLKRAEAARDSLNGTIFVKPNKKIVVIPAKMKAFVAKGILGQYIYVNPETNVVLVRLGKYWSEKRFGRAETFMYEAGRRIY